MRYIWQHIQTIIESYNGSMPLTHFLKQYYKQYPKLGSRDRKILSEMAYSWYRCSKGIEKDTSFENKIKNCLQLAGSGSKHIQQFLPETKQDSTFIPENLFPYPVELSAGITHDSWLNSILQQPDVFLRVRDRGAVISKLEENGIPFKYVDEYCISVPNGSAVDKILPPDSYAVQDASSQETTKFFHPKAGEFWWDCCSGAGGKSLALVDIQPKIHLTVSDKRESILHNLEKRFRQYHLPVPVQYVTDIANAESLQTQLGNKRFDNIICDVPCTGSGTWARTPEQIYFFDALQLPQLSSLQATIARNASAYLKPGGKLFYITCSVFRQENEDVVDKVCTDTGLKIQNQNLINGIEKKADSMFISVLEKN